MLRGTDERFPPSLFLRSTALTEVNPAMATFVRELRSESDGDVLGFLHALMVQINEHMTFDEDPTNSGTSAAEAFALKRGVCQDYAHIFIACARSGGVPARFVSGHFLRSDGTVNQQAGHAWAEAYVPDLGWVGFDPANGICTTDAHARVAIGLDYLGAAPVRGTRYGGGTETLTVAVKVDQAGGPGSGRASRSNQCTRVGWAKARLRRAHHLSRIIALDGGSLIQSYRSRWWARFAFNAHALLTMKVCHLSSHTSSNRRLLYWLLSCGLKFFT